MKDFNINCRISSDLKDTVEYLKVTGGITSWLENNLRKVVVDQDLLARIHKARSV